MLGKTVKSLFAAIFHRKSNTIRRARPAYHRPRLEVLEDRLAPANLIYDWIGGGGNLNWSNGNNWQIVGSTTHGVPDSMDTVQFSSDHNVGSMVDFAFQGTVKEVDITSGYTAQITLQRSLMVTTTKQDGGIIFGSFSWIVPGNGTYDWTGGSLKGFGSPSALTVIQSGATMTISSQAAFLNGRTIQNNGLIIWNGAQGVPMTISLNDEATIQQNGTFRTNAGIYYFDGDGTGTFANNGAFELANFATVDFLSSMKVTNTGSFNLVGVNSDLRFDGQTTFSGGLVYGPGITELYGELKLSSGSSATVKSWFFGRNGSLFSSGGAVMFQNGGHLVIEGATIDNAQIYIDPLSTLDVFANLTLNNAASVYNAGITIWHSGIITLNLTGKITNLNGGNFSAQSLVNNLAMNGAGSFINNSGGTVEVWLGANTLTLNNPFINSGVLKLKSGTLIIPTNWTQPAGGRTNFEGGDLRVGGTFTNNGLIWVFDSGRVEANLLLNNGSIDMTQPIQRPAVTLTVARLPNAMNGGDFTQGTSGSLYMGILGDLDNDKLSVTGTATLGGFLEVRLGNNYQPAGNQRSWTLLFYNQENGQFGAVNRPLRFDLPVYGNQSTSITWRPI